MSRDEIQQILEKLNELSERKTEKTVTMHVMPTQEGWSCEFDFSDDELLIAYEITNELDYLMNFQVAYPLFAYKAK